MDKIVKIQMDKERHLRYGVKAFITIEKTAGKTISELIGAEMLETLPILIYGGLVWEDRKLSYDNVIAIIDEMVEKVAEEKGVNFMEAMGEVFNEFAPSVFKAMGIKEEEINALPSE